MTDNQSPEVRKKIMQSVRGKNTGPERMVKSFLHKKGYRFRNNVRTLPGTPDIVLPKYKAAIFINGCFWHGHTGCRRFTIPKTNPAFWKAKIDKNIKRDDKVENQLINLGWKVITVWQCQLSNKLKYGTLNSILYELEANEY